MSGHEVVTVQLGNVSNFVGTHWWNIQQSSFSFEKAALEDETRLNHKILFREGENYRGERTFTPRLVSVNARGTVGNSELSGYLYDPNFTSPTEPGVDTWSNDRVDVRPQQETRRNQFLADLHSDQKAGVFKTKDSVEQRYYNLDQDVRYWTDFLRIPLHPRSVINIPSVGNSPTGISKYEDGLEIVAASAVADQLEDDIRRFVEETDLLQGFHVLCDIHDCFAGISDWTVSHLIDQYPRSAIMAVPLVMEHAPKTPLEAAHFIWNCAQAVQTLEHHSSLITPMSLSENPWARLAEYRNFPLLSYKPDLLYHTSAIVATCLECVSTPWRIYDAPDHLADAAATVTAGGSTKMTEMKVSLPWDLQGQSLGRRMAELSKDEWFDTRPITPCSSGDTNNQYCRLAIRGLKHVNFLDDLPTSHDYRRICSPADLLQEYLSKMGKTCSCYCGLEPVHTSAPFPHIFNSQVDVKGHLLKHTALRPSNVSVKSIPVMTEITGNHCGILKTLSDLLSKTDNVKLKTEKDYFEEVCSDLLTFQDPRSLSC